MTVSMANPSTRYQVALVDPLPAGLEAINPALQGSQEPQEKRDWWSRLWFDHENMRDDRVEVFTSYLHSGFHTYSYYARATTSSPRPPKPRKCITPKPSAVPPPTRSPSTPEERAQIRPNVHFPARGPLQPPTGGP